MGGTIAVDGYLSYEPQGVPIAIADNLWIVEGAVVPFSVGCASIPCPTRMTVVRLGAHDLWLHSPVPPTSDLISALNRLGHVRWLIAPSSHHHLHIASWASAYPCASVHAVAGLVGRLAAKDVIAVPLGVGADAVWASALRQTALSLPSFEETVFLHESSATLIVTDLMQNFEAERVGNLFKRLLLQVAGATGPVGSTSLEVRMAALGRREKVRALRDEIIAWEPRRVVLAHGRVFETDAVAEVRRAFRWAGG